MLQYFSGLNYLAILVSGIAFFFLGFLWYSKLFGKMWAAELEKIGLKFNEPSKSDMGKKMVISLVANILVALALAIIIKYLNLTTIAGAFHLALLAGVGISGATIMINYNWEGKSMKSFLIDFFHMFVGIFICSVIIISWQQ
jgi:hypothetical protein